MNDTSQKVLDRLAGRDMEEIRRIRKREWYSRWNTFADFLDTNPSKRDIMLRVDNLLNQQNGYHYNHVAASAAEAISLICRERGY